MTSRTARHLRNCHENPEEYKLCANRLCVPVIDECPCATKEFQCLDGTCLHPSLLCNHNNDCAGGEDEKSCGTNMEQDINGDNGLPVEVAVGVISVLVVAVALIIIFIVLVRRRRLRARQQDSGSEPLRSQTTSSDPSVDAEKTPDSCEHSKALPKQEDLEDGFSLFDGALCTSTPRPDIRRQVHPGTIRQGSVPASKLKDVL